MTCGYLETVESLESIIQNIIGVTVYAEHKTYYTILLVIRLPLLKNFDEQKVSSVRANVILPVYNNNSES